jgi:hypothetical protein
MRRLARLYAARLPGLLVQDYGASETYNDAQITACVRRAKLPEAGLLMARAAFLPEAAFTAKYGEDQAPLRQLFKDSLPSVVSTAEQICGTSDAANVSYVGGSSI